MFDSLVRFPACSAVGIILPEDHYSDCKTQIAVYRKTGTTSSDTGTFWVRRDDGSYSVVPWGNGFDFPIAGRLY
ncbi:MAG: hypothetical protein KIS76_16070 [Pyrinomonadaceae bacterium]|nr:hypothetical protein [Pyrinomonadaceae bacterium]